MKRRFTLRAAHEAEKRIIEFDVFGGEREIQFARVDLRALLCEQLAATVVEQVPAEGEAGAEAGGADSFYARLRTADGDIELDADVRLGVYLSAPESDQLLYRVAQVLRAAGHTSVAGWRRENPVVAAMLREAVRYPVRDFPDGRCGVVIGKVQCAGEPLIAPLSGRKCAAYEIHVEERSALGAAQILVHECHTQDFAVVEGSDYAWVIAQEATLPMEMDLSERTGLLHRPSERLTGLLAERGHDTHGRFFRRGLHVREGALEIDERVAVFGLGSWVADSQMSADFRTIARRLVLYATDDYPLHVTDEPLIVQTPRRRPWDIGSSDFKGVLERRYRDE